MKTTKTRVLILSVLAFLVMGIGGVFLLTGAPNSTSDDDKYGKVTGYIVDPKTGQPVNEIFDVEFITIEDNYYGYRVIERIRTNERGYFSGRVPLGKCFLISIPKKEDSIYCFEPSPLINKKYAIPVSIEKGKTTNIIKTATIGGALRVIFVDKKGREIDPQSQLDENASIHLCAENPNYVYAKVLNCGLFASAAKGIILRKLFPGLYTVTSTFGGLGFPGDKKEGVIVNEGSVTDIKIVFDLEDQTSVEGYVIDKNGKVMKNAEVSLLPKFKSIDIFRGITDKKGYYKITGLPSGFYDVDIYITDAPVFILKEIVEVKKNLTIKKNITLNWASDR